MVTTLASPLELSWADFATEFVSVWKQGQHCLFVGPAGSGKTVAARTFARARKYNLVLGTKMRDTELDAYLAEGYYRLDHWPPTKVDYHRARENWRPGEVRFALWPKITKRADLRRFRPVYANALDSTLVDGGWTVVCDEGLWTADRAGLDLGDHLAALAYTGRSMGVTLMILLQRPRGVPINCWSNASYAFLWHMGNADDVRDMSSLGTEDARSVQAAVKSLGGHDFLWLPCRAGSEWAISRVDLT
jgi:hypothetical protein